jgi:hypothetical protein
MTLDFGNISALAGLTGQTDFLVGLTAWTHEDFHVLDANGASTLQAATAANAAGDQPSHAGANDTTGGTATPKQHQRRLQHISTMILIHSRGGAR